MHGFQSQETAFNEAVRVRCWKPGDDVVSCWEDDKGQGQNWRGRVVGVSPTDPVGWPEGVWESVVVEGDDGSTERLSPWELQPITAAAAANDWELQLIEAAADDGGTSNNNGDGSRSSSSSSSSSSISDASYASLEEAVGRVMAETKAGQFIEPVSEDR